MAPLAAPEALVERSALGRYSRRRLVCHGGGILPDPVAWRAAWLTENIREAMEL